MANSTFYDTVNQILLLAGQTTVADTSTFDTNAFLSKTQVQCKLFVDMANRGIVRKLRARFLKREFSIAATTYPGTANSYPLDPTTRLENVVDDSVFISTTNFARKLEFMPYEEHKKRFPKGETVAGIPMYWYDLPRLDDQIDNIAFSPPVSQALTITYESYTRPAVLTLAADEIQFEPEWEDVLWQYGLMWLEMSLAEGKMQAIQQFLDPMFAEIRQLTLGASAKPPSVDLGIYIPDYRRGRRSAYSPG